MFVTTTTGYTAKISDDKTAIELIAKAGFDSFDYSCNVCGEDSPIYGDRYREYAEELNETARTHNIVCTQSHAVFPSAIYGDDEFNEKQFAKIVRNIEFAALLGAKCIVVHPIHEYPDESDIRKINMGFYNRLLPYAKKSGIKIAVENMIKADPTRTFVLPSVCGKSDELVDYLDGLDSEWFVACLDVGHSVLSGEEPEDAIKNLGPKILKSVHIHDNDRHGDMHSLPFLGKINWDSVCNAFREIGYDGEFTFEAESFLKGFPFELFPEALSFMHRVGRYMAERTELR